MTTPRFSLAFVMDPIDSIDIDADTTFVLMLEAQRRGHEILYLDPGDLSIIDGRPASTVTPVTLRRQRGAYVEKGPARRVFLDEEIDAALQRVDPPVDADYIAATQILSLCERTLVLNRPQSVLAYNEKLFALAFHDLMPETVVSRRIADLRDFMDKMGGEMIVKPLDGKGGEGIFHAREGDGNLSSILEQVTAFEGRVAMAQRYLPEVRQGDKRILLLNGEFLGAVLRVPAEAEVRANLHVGARAAKTELTAADRRIIDRLAPVLRENGLFFVGIDVIGGMLTEINVTSPTGVQEVNALDETCLEARVIDGLEEMLSGR
jgi:glutathione synthase